jgi:hypothetical protein
VTSFFYLLHRVPLIQLILHFAEIYLDRRKRLELKFLLESQEFLVSLA